MKLLTFNKSGRLNLRHSAGTIVHEQVAGIEYVYPEAAFVRTMQHEAHLIRHTSDLTSMTRNFVAGANYPGGSLLYYCGAGGIGDELMGIPVVLHLCDLGYDVTVLCDGGHAAVWENCDRIRGTLHLPLEYEKWVVFDHHCIFDSVTNLNEHPFQHHPTEAMALRIGVDPQDLQCMVHNLWFTEAERAAAQMRQEAVPYDYLGMYQLGSSREIRRADPLHSAKILKALATTYEDTYWTVLKDASTPKAAIELAASLELPNLVIRQYDDMRELFADVEQTDIIVGPDSMMIHLAGTMNRPFVALFSNIDPMKRIGRYASGVALWQHEACKAAPCYHHRSGFPDVCPPSLRPRTECECIKQIPTADILKAVDDLRQ